MIEFSSNTTRKETPEERKDFANGRGCNLPPGYALLSATEKAAAWAMLASLTPDDTQRSPTRPTMKGSYRAW